MNTVLADKLSDLQKNGVAPIVLAKMGEYIESAPPPRLQQMSAYRMADEWQLPRADVLMAFLYGTRVGLFDLEWSIHCPSCTGVTAHTLHLMQLKSESHCDYCKIQIDASFDQSVEVTFRVNDNVRKVEIAPYGELAQHWDYADFLGQFEVAPGETREIPTEFAAGHYYVGYPPVIVAEGTADGPQTLDIAWDGKEWQRKDKNVRYPGPCLIRAENAADQPATVYYIRRKQYPWTSAAEITSLQNFRDLFSSELISADETFSIRNLFIVFTDIKGSTALYERLGDSDAYYLVKEHFRILTDVVRKHNGAVVKTIGDAVMATFMVSSDAMHALLAMQAAFEAFDVQEKIPEGHIIIKVGGHRGPCIAVNSNDRLDYFGRTVNIAARVQGLSTGRDIMLTRSFYEEPSVSDIVTGSDWQVRHFKAELRGIEAQYDLVHLTFNA
ncbi:MAG TPA: DUF5939 domain-containing protein [Anaerolineae bacterium]|nr:DUF5939 domain-containing protein [Anaerolineae bacterium]